MKAKNTILAKRGQVFKTGVGYRVKVLSVIGRKSPQPKVRYKRLRRRGEALHWLQWRSGAWRLPEDWRPV